MSLATVNRYDPSRVRRLGDHAVVVGGSMAGLLTARVLADWFDRVTVLERDDLADGPEPRRGVPQAQHPHALMVAGQATLEDLLPGFRDELLAAGALSLDLATEFSVHAAGGFIAPGPERIPVCFASRGLIEHLVRERVAADDRILLRPGCQVTDCLASPDGTAVRGVTVLAGGRQEQVEADLVVDAMGRATRTPRWLEGLGFHAPRLEEVRIDVAYATCQVKRPPDDRRAVFVMPAPPRTRGGAVFPIEKDRWLVTLSGLHGDHPPDDLAGVRQFAAGLPTPVVAEVLDGHPRVSDDLARYRFPAHSRYRYDKVRALPDGLLAIGDAVASFNPVYGQGMSVAALETVVLHHTLADHGLAGLARRFSKASASIVEDAWALAAGGDFQFPQTTGPKPPGTDLVNRYIDRLHRKSHADGRLNDAFNRVVVMERPPTSLLRPEVAWRVLRPGTGGRREAA